MPEIIRSMASRPRHEALRGLITELLREGFGAAFSELEHERYLVDNSGGLPTHYPVATRPTTTINRKRRGAWPSLFSSLQPGVSQA